MLVNHSHEGSPFREAKPMPLTMLLSTRASTCLHIHPHTYRMTLCKTYDWDVLASLGSSFFRWRSRPTNTWVGTGVAGSRWAHLQDYKSLLPDSLFIFTKRHPAHSSLLQRSTGKQEIRCPQCCVAFCFATRFHGKVALHHQLGLCSKLYRRWRWVSSSKMSRKYIGTCINCMRIFPEFEPSRSLWVQLHFLPPILNIRKPSVAAAVMPAVFNVCIAPSPMDAISCRCTSPKAAYKHSQHI